MQPPPGLIPAIHRSPGAAAAAAFSVVPSRRLASPAAAAAAAGLPPPPGSGTYWAHAHSAPQPTWLGPPQHPHTAHSFAPPAMPGAAGGQWPMPGGGAAYGVMHAPPPPLLQQQQQQWAFGPMAAAAQQQQQLQAAQHYASFQCYQAQQQWYTAQQHPGYGDEGEAEERYYSIGPMPQVPIAYDPMGRRFKGGGRRGGAAVTTSVASNRRSLAPSPLAACRCSTAWRPAASAARSATRATAAPRGPPSCDEPSSRRRRAGQRLHGSRLPKHINAGAPAILCSLCRQCPLQHVCNCHHECISSFACSGCGSVVSAQDRQRAKPTRSPAPHSVRNIAATLPLQCCPNGAFKLFIHRKTAPPSRAQQPPCRPPATALDLERLPKRRAARNAPHPHLLSRPWLLRCPSWHERLHSGHLSSGNGGAAEALAQEPAHAVRRGRLPAAALRRMGLRNSVSLAPTSGGHMVIDAAPHTPPCSPCRPYASS